MSDGFYHGKDSHYGVKYTPDELKLRSLETDADRIYSDDGIKLYRETVQADENGIVHICPEHGRTYHEYDLKKEKIMNHEIKCPMCGIVGKTEGDFILDIPPKWSDNEY